MDDEKYYDDVIIRVNKKFVEEVREDVIVVEDSEIDEDYNILGCIALLVMFALFCWDKGLVYIRG